MEIVNTQSLCIALDKLNNYLSNLVNTKTDYCSVYLSARESGKLIQEKWIDFSAGQLDVDKLISRWAKTKANTFQVECHRHQQKKVLVSTAKTNLNCFRGVRAIVLEHGQHKMNLSGLGMVAKNVSVERSLEKFRETYQLSIKDSITITLLQVKQFYFDNGQTTNNSMLQTYRGGRLIDIVQVTKQSLLVSAKAMTYWLTNQVNQTGLCTYKYWPSNGNYSTANNAIRQWMATVCLGRSAQFFSSQNVELVDQRNLDFNLRDTFRVEDNIGYVWMHSSANWQTESLHGGNDA